MNDSIHAADLTGANAIPADWLVPDWPAPAQVHALCTTRSGGVSTGPFASLNPSLNVGDDAVKVLQNRELLALAMRALEAKNTQNSGAPSAAAAASAAQPLFLQQVHAVGVKLIDGCSPAGQHADASVTATPGVGCAIMVADCLPVMFSHATLPVVGAAHAGWRGLVGQGGVGVLETCFDAYADLVRQHVGAATSTADIAANTLAWLGPCIGQPVFEVGAEVREAFVAHDAGAGALFADGKPGKFYANLSGLARRRLAARGITQLYGNDGTEAWCTVSNPSRYFSHRRDGTPSGGTGRLVVCVWTSAS